MMKRSPQNYWITAVGVLPSRDFEIIGAIVRITKTNTIFKRLVNKLFTVENTYHETNQTDKARELKFRWEAAVAGEQKRKYEF